MRMLFSSVFFALVHGFVHRLGGQYALLCALAMLFVLPFSVSAQTLAEHSADPHSSATPIYIYPLPKTSIAEGVTVFEARDLERLQARTLADILRYVPGVATATSGGAGQPGSIFLRGTNSNHVLVLLDGVPLNDPSSPGGAVDTGYLSLDHIARVEIVRGAQSAEAGPGALGGVIRLTSGDVPPSAKVVEGYRLSQRAALEAGSFNTRRGEWAATYRDATTAINMALADRHTAGISAVSSRLGGEERDGALQQSFAAAWEQTLNADTEIFAQLRGERTRAEYDSSFPFADADYLARTRQWTGSGGVRHTVLPNVWTQSFTTSHRRIERDNRDDFPRTTRGSVTQANWEHALQPTAAWDARFGVTAQRETIDSAADFSTLSAARDLYAVYANQRWNWSSAWVWEAALRLDAVEQAGSTATYRFGTRYTLPVSDTVLAAHYATGFRPPSLFEQRDVFYGNPNLAPERNREITLGIEQPLWSGRAQLGSNVFWNDIANLIQADPRTFVAENIGAARIRGVEATALLALSPAWNVQAYYTLTDTEDRATHQALLRRPRQQAMLQTRYIAGPVISELEWLGVSARADSAFPERVRVPGYSVLNLRTRWEMSDSLALYGRLENLFDRDYEEVFGYATPGRAGYAGIVVEF